jgi:hypothetical protein
MKIINLLAVVAIMSSLWACRAGAPIYDVSGANVTAAAGKSVEADQVKLAIIRAGGKLGWKIDETTSGQLRGMLMLRAHTAIIDIMYDENTYSIKYNSSTNLEHSKGTIHKNYNGWIQNLQREIDVELGNL